MRDCTEKPVVVEVGWAEMGERGACREYDNDEDWENPRWRCAARCFLT